MNSTKICFIHKEKITKALKNANLKITPTRTRLMDVLEHAGKPVSVKETKKLLKTPGIDIVTIYRNLELLNGLGLVSQVFLDQKEAYFELADRGHHHHAVCENCGLVVDIPELEQAQIDKHALKSSGFAKINRHALEFFGICKSCASKKAVSS